MKYESLLEQMRAKDKTEEHWRVCPTCLDSFIGVPGQECSQCGGVTRRAPLYNIELAPGFYVCDGCGFKATGEITKIGRFRICERCIKIANDEKLPFVKECEIEKIKKRIRRANAITDLMKEKTHR